MFFELVSFKLVSFKLASFELICNSHASALNDFWNDANFFSKALKHMEKGKCEIKLFFFIIIKKRFYQFEKVIPSVSGIWTGLNWLWWLDFKLKKISVIVRTAPKSCSLSKSGQKWSQNNHLATFTKFLIHFESVVPNLFYSRHPFLPIEQFGSTISYNNQ